MSLDNIRNKIDDIDRNIIKLLNDRMKLSLELKSLKKDIKDEKREEEVYKNVLNSNVFLSEKFIIELYKLIIEESIRLQKKKG